MATDKQTKRLGRGLDALLGSRSNTDSDTASQQSGVQHIAILAIQPNPYQPRKEFKPEELAELEQSVKANGLLQPITVRKGPAGTHYELIAGERRLRAATRLGWREIPALVKEVDDRTLLTFALIENLQRSDLNPLEEAEGYSRLITDFHLSHQEVADAVGKDRSTIANLLRILHLPHTVQDMLRSGALTLGHARSLLALNDEKRIHELAIQAVSGGWSVREVERQVRENAPKPAKRGRGRPMKPAKTAEVSRIEDAIRKRLQTDTTINLRAAEKGEIVISFYSSDDLERILEAMDIHLYT